MHSLSNKNINISIKERGAELCSLKHNDIEYIWQGNPEYWPKHSPVLFPVIGRLKNDTCFFEGKKYNIKQHGFAGGKEFKLVGKSEKKLYFLLSYDEETLTNYPFKFELHITYELSETSLNTSYKVVNIDDKDMFFSIGAHPGFNCPLLKGENYGDYYLEFEIKETARRFYITKDALISGKTEYVLQNENILNLSKELFKDGALLFKEIKSQSVTLKNRKNNNGIKVCFKGFPYLGIWAKYGADFVCIEPWHGIVDSENTNQVFETKEGIIKLPEGKTFETSYSISIT